MPKKPIGIKIEIDTFSHLFTLVFSAASPFRTMKANRGKIAIQIGMNRMKKLIWFPPSNLWAVRK